MSSNSDDAFFNYLRDKLTRDRKEGRLSEDEYWAEVYYLDDELQVTLRKIHTDNLSVHKENLKDDEEDALNEYR